MKSKLLLILTIIFVAVACSPVGDSTAPSTSSTFQETTPATGVSGTSEDTTPYPQATNTPVALPVPVPYDLILPADASADQISLFEWLKSCAAESSVTTGTLQVLECAGVGDLQGMTLSLLPLASVAAIHSDKIMDGSLKLVAVVTTATTTAIGSVAAVAEAGVAVVGAIVASPAAVPAAVVAVSAAAGYAVLTADLSVDPVVADWVAGKTPSEMQSILAGYASLGGIAVAVDDQVGIDSNVDVGAFADRYEIPPLFLGKRAVILEDDPLHALNSYLVLRLFGFDVLGIYPTCSSWLASGNTYAHFFLVDQLLADSTPGNVCAQEHIRTWNPAAFILIYSSLGDMSDTFLSRYVNQIRGMEGTGTVDAFRKATSVWRFVEYLKGITLP